MDTYRMPLSQQPHRWVIEVLRANEMHEGHCDLLYTRKNQRRTGAYLTPQPCNCWLKEEEN